MSGAGTFSGTSYQAGVIAYVGVHAVLEQRLGWFDLLEDSPYAVSGETSGPADDARVEFARFAAGVQAKHGLKGEKAVTDVLTSVTTPPDPGQPKEPRILAVDSSSSLW